MPFDTKSKREKNVIRNTEMLDLLTGEQAYKVSQLEKQTDELEDRYYTDKFNTPPPQTSRSCSACQHLKDKEMENNPLIRELQDKVERLHMKAVWTNNQNWLLKRQLMIAKKVICQELGIEHVDFQAMMNKASNKGWKGRSEKVMLLESRNRALEEKLNNVQGASDETVGPSPSQKFAEQNVTEDRKAFWRMELEKRKGFELADKERRDLEEECAMLRRKIEKFSHRIREVINENNMLRGELDAMQEKTRDDHGLIESLKNSQQQLIKMQEERSELRRLLDGARTRNKVLEDHLNLQSSQIRTLSAKCDSDDSFINSYEQQQKNLQTMLEREQMVSHQLQEKFKSEIQRLTSRRQMDVEMLRKIQSIISQKDEAVKRIRDQLESLLTSSSEEEEEEEIAVETEESEDQGSRSSKDAEPVQSDQQAQAQTEGEGEEIQAEELSETQLLQLEIAKFKGLYEVAKTQSNQMTDILLAMNNKIDHLMIVRIESEREWLRKDFELKEMTNKLQALEKALKEKKKKPGQSKAKTAKSKKPSVKADELEIKLELMTEENDFLRCFLATALSGKEGDFYVFKSMAEFAENHFETSLNAIIAEFQKQAEKDEPREEEKEEVEEEKIEEVVPPTPAKAERRPKKK